MGYDKSIFETYFVVTYSNFMIETEYDNCLNAKIILLKKPS